MKLSTVLAGAAMAGAALVSASAANAAFVLEAYNYGATPGPQDTAGVLVVNDGANTYSDVQVSSSYGTYDLGALAAGQTTLTEGLLGDPTEGGIAPGDPFTVTVLSGGQTYTHTFNDVLGDIDSQTTFELGSFSTPGTPEPATWAMMLVGVAGLGGVLRSSRKRAVAV